jgi:cation diffusion facilitator CzcD-associated flavoprotein CzcO
MKTHYKTIIVGGGHNGLVAAAYLAKSGIATSFYHLHCEKNCYKILKLLSSSTVVRL